MTKDSLDREHKDEHEGAVKVEDSNGDVCILTFNVPSSSTVTSFTITNIYIIYFNFSLL